MTTDQTKIWRVTPELLDEAYCRFIDLSGSTEIVIRGAAMIDAALALRLAQLHRFESETAKRAFFTVSGPAGSLMRKLDLASSLQIIDKLQYDDGKTIDTIRNLFAHSYLDVDFDELRVVTYCNELGISHERMAGCHMARDRFIWTCVCRTAEIAGPLMGDVWVEGTEELIEQA